MSGTGMPAGPAVSASYGHGAGFWQSPSAFSGLTNNDLRPRRRRRRRRRVLLPLLDPTWPANSASRRKGATMRKEISAHLDTLKKSVVEIALSGVDNRDELLGKSIDQFQAALLGDLTPVLPIERKPLAKELEPVAKFAELLQRTANDVALVKSEVSPEAGELLDRFVTVGSTVLSTLVNATGSLIDSEEELDKAEKAGQIIEIDVPDGESYLLKSELPQQYHELFTDPVDMLTQYALIGREFSNQAIALADDLNKAELLPPTIAEEFPELFLEVDSDKLGKALFGRRDPGDDETVGAGGDPDAANDPGDDQPDDTDQDPDLTDDTPQNPVEMMVRLASIIVVVGGSMLQSGAQPGMDADANDQSDVSGMPDDDQAANPGLQRQEPIGDMAKGEQLAVGELTLEKIMAGQAAVHPSLADALEEGLVLRKTNDTMAKQLSDTQTQLATLQATVDRLSRQPEPPKGVLFTVAKSAESLMPGQASAQEAADRINQLAQTDPELASKTLLKGIHAGGGVPLVPAS